MEGAKKRAPEPKPPMTIPVARPFLKRKLLTVLVNERPVGEPVNDCLYRRGVHRAVPKGNQAD